MQTATRKFRRMLALALLGTLPWVLSASDNTSPKREWNPWDPAYSLTSPGNLQRSTFPQAIASPNISTKVKMRNQTGIDCDFGAVVHEGALRAPDVPVLLNGQLNPVLIGTLPAGGIGILNLTMPAGLNETFEGGLTLEVLTPGCFDHVQTAIGYTFLGGNGALQEVFSYERGLNAPLGSCVSAVVDYDPVAGQDDIIRIPGFAHTSFFTLAETECCGELFDRQGQSIAGPTCNDFDGTQDAFLLSEMFPTQTAFEGTWQICYDGQLPPDTTTRPGPSTLFIGVEQRGPNVQLEAIPSGRQNGNCVPTATTLCLNDGRFRVEVEWRDDASPSPQPASGSTVNDDGLFFFFDANNWEMLVKVIDGCSTAASDHFWVFHGALTNVEYTLTVTDTLANEKKTYFNPLGQPANAVTDTMAFATCP